MTFILRAIVLPGVGGFLGASLFIGIVSLWRKYGHRPHQANSGSQARALQDAINSAARAVAAGTAAGSGARPRVVEQEILAERAWNLCQDERGPLLYSLVHQTAWPEPAIVADAIPSERTRNGIYAQRHLEAGYRTSAVVGTVALSGIVVEGENGYRAERAVIRSLRLRMLPETTPIYVAGGGNYCPPISTGGYSQTWKHRVWQVAEQLAERYQCECTVDWIPVSTLPADLVVD